MITKIFRKIISPLSLSEDQRRVEFILNILLLSCLGLSGTVLCINILRNLIGAPTSFSPIAIISIFLFFLLLFLLSKKGFHKVASYSLISIFFFLTTYLIYMWGSDLPSALLVYVLIIVMAGVLISTFVAFVATIVISTVLSLITYFQVNSLIPVDAFWKKDATHMNDIIVFVIIFLIIAVVSWLSNREIEKSLKRARKSEAELKLERDSLEIKVEEKTRELKEAQAEKVAQLYRFAEFGRISSGLFHDLVNPLSAVSLNIEKVKGKEAEETKEDLDRAILAARKMENLVNTVRKQLRREETKTNFSVNEEIKQVIDILRHKGDKEGVEIKFKSGPEVSIFGDATKFHYAILNLISNAIDSYKNTTSRAPVEVELFKNKEIVISIKDFGSGISEGNLKKIFEPFFTTKSSNDGTGLGLPITKRMLEKDFGGVLEVESMEGKGTVFVIKIPCG